MASYWPTSPNQSIPAANAASSTRALSPALPCTNPFPSSSASECAVRSALNTAICSRPSRSRGVERPEVSARAKSAPEPAVGEKGPEREAGQKRTEHVARINAERDCANAAFTSGGEPLKRQHC